MLIRREAPPGVQPDSLVPPLTTFDGRGILARSVPWSLTMLDPRALTHAQLAEIVADVQAILWQESLMFPDDRYGRRYLMGHASNTRSQMHRRHNALMPSPR